MPCLRSMKLSTMPGLERARRNRPPGDHVFETVRLQPLDEVLHAAGFELEHRRRLVALQEARTTSLSSMGMAAMSTGGLPSWRDAG